MVEKLLDFIKSAKNRDELIKALEKWKNQFHQKTTKYKLKSPNSF